MQFRPAGGAVVGYALIGQQRGGVAWASTIGLDTPYPKTQSTGSAFDRSTWINRKVKRKIQVVAPIPVPQHPPHTRGRGRATSSPAACLREELGGANELLVQARFFAVWAGTGRVPSGSVLTTQTNTTPTPVWLLVFLLVPRVLRPAWCASHYPTNANAVSAPRSVFLSCSYYKRRFPFLPPINSPVYPPAPSPHQEPRHAHPSVAAAAASPPSSP